VPLVQSLRVMAKQINERTVGPVSKEQVLSLGPEPKPRIQDEDVQESSDTPRTYGHGLVAFGRGDLHTALSSR